MNLAGFVIFLIIKDHLKTKTDYTHMDIVGSFGERFCLNSLFFLVSKCLWVNSAVEFQLLKYSVQIHEPTFLCTRPT